MRSAQSSLMAGEADEIVRETRRSTLSDSRFSNRRSPGDLGLIGNADYKGALRRTFDRSEIQSILKEARREVWPDLNKKAVKLVSASGFSKAWSNKGVNIRFAHLASDGGKNLLGFYIGKTAGVSNRPLICVNTANHPAIVGAALDHEMGHHVTAQLFQLQKESARFLSYTGFVEHLCDPAELAADILVSLCIIPNKTARMLYESEDSSRLGRTSRMLDSRLVNALDVVARTFRIDLKTLMSGKNGRQGLQGLIHYIRLRFALLEGFDL